MKLEQVKELIRTKEQWDSEELLRQIRAYKAPKSITLFYIQGYECLRDGTQEGSSAASIEEFLSIWEVDESELDLTIDPEITDLHKYVKKYFEPYWEEIYNDGGGSGWIEYNN
jgi:hypothetical protein